MAGAPLQKGRLRVRMYRVGFGDCFLMSLPQGDGHAHIVVDCGVHAQGDIGKIADAVADIAKETGGRLAIVIASHAHQDHISGFATSAAAFSQMSVGEVWLPWTEDPDDAQAASLRKKQVAAVDALKDHLAATGGSDEASAMVQNAHGNAAALRLLKSGINGGKVRYIEAGQSLDQPAGVEGLSVRFLGPPRTQAFLEIMDPPSGDRYLRAAAGGPPQPVNPAKPFDWTLDRDAMPAYLRIDPAEARAMGEEAANLDALAFTIDRALNNSSVVALFSFGPEHLLFPGDAQYGNWSSWLDGPDATDILAGLDFLKVAHHGSLNATPKRVVEGLSAARAHGMVSTQNKPWASIPRAPLIDALVARTGGRIVRSDAIQVAGAPNAPEAAAPPGFVNGDFWQDYAP